jgi:hypothetical protein
MVPDSDIVSAEEIYAKAMDGRGLPEDLEEESDDSEEKNSVEYAKPHKTISGSFKKFLNALYFLFEDSLLLLIFSILFLVDLSILFVNLVA